MEQKFVNSLVGFSSNWIRIIFDNNEAYTNDEFRGTIGHVDNYFSVIEPINNNLDMVNFELWERNALAGANNNGKSAINIAELYWQGLDP